LQQFGSVIPKFSSKDDVPTKNQLQQGEKLGFHNRMFNLQLPRAIPYILIDQTLETVSTHITINQA
jgi:hypothetical protein